MVRLVISLAQAQHAAEDGDGVMGRAERPCGGEESGTPARSGPRGAAARGAPSVAECGCRVDGDDVLLRSQPVDVGDRVVVSGDRGSGPSWPAGRPTLLPRC